MRILIAESSRQVLAPVEAYLNSYDCSYTAHYALGYEDLAAQARRYAPQIILAGDQLVSLDNGNIQDICQAHPGGKTVVLMDDLDIHKARRLLSCGVDGCVRPSLDARVLVKVLKLIMTGEKYVPADLIEKPGDARPGTVCRLPELTPRENDVLAMLMQGCTNKAIAEALRRKEITVTSHLKQIFKKLGADNRTQAALIALERMRLLNE